LGPKTYGIGVKLGQKCHWDRANDNYITIRWENKTIWTIVVVFGTGLFTEAGWPKDVPIKLCKYTPKRYETKHAIEKAARDLALAEEHRIKISKFKNSVFISERARELAYKRSRRFVDDDLGSNKYNCVDDEDIVVFEDVEQAIEEFRAILYNPEYYKIEEAEKAAILAAELAAEEEADEEAEEMADELAAEAAAAEAAILAARRNSMMRNREWSLEDF
jgi:hypothetical protein